MNNHLLFLTGIPNGTVPSTITSKFANLGFTVKLMDQRNRTIKNLSFITNGYCLIETSSHQAYQTLLEMRHVAFAGRSLILKPYLTGVELFKENRKTNKRRILLKLVPSYITDEEIRKHLSLKFGGIKEFYQLQHKKPLIESKQRPFKTYSIMFEEPILEKSVENYTLELRKGLFIKLERFSIEKKKKSRKNIPNLQVVKRSTCSTIQEDRFSFAMNPTSNCFGKNCGKSLIFNSKSLPKADLNTSKVDPCTSIRCFSVSSKNGKLTAANKIGFLNDLLEECQFQKPNSKVYRLLRSHDSEYLGKFELKDSWTARSNFRENQQTGIL